MSHNFKVAWNAMPMFLWCDRKIGRWVRDSRTDAGVWSALTVMRHPVPQNTVQVVFR